MKPMPLRTRILGALQLQPMTISELGRVLSANVVSIRHYIEELQGMGILSRGQTVRRGSYRPEALRSIRS